VINFAPGKFEYLEQSSFQHSFCRILQIQAKEAFTGKLDADRSDESQSQSFAHL
jgi:hypothetical protein